MSTLLSEGYRPCKPDGRAGPAQPSERELLCAHQRTVDRRFPGAFELAVDQQGNLEW